MLTVKVVNYWVWTVVAVSDLVVWGGLFLETPAIRICGYDKSVIMLLVLV